MISTALFQTSFLLYILSALVSLAFNLWRRVKLSLWGYSLAIAGFTAHTAALVSRFLQSGHAPFTNMYESLSFFSWALVLAYIWIEGRHKIRLAGLYVMLIVIALMALASSPLMPKDVSPLIPALQSYWLWLHVSVTLIGEAFFAIAFVTSIMYLFVLSREKRGRTASLSSSSLDALSYRCISIGFPLFTLGGLIFGMIWAHKAWGRYWSWDPKEVWSLITWFVFALYLHTRITHGWRGKRSAVVAVIGFLCALFTYFGVNYLLAGLHSYI